MPPKLLTGGHFGLLLQLQLKDNLSSLIARAQISKPFHSKGMIKKTRDPAQLVPPSGDLQGPAMRPLLVLLRLNKIPSMTKLSS